MSLHVLLDIRLLGKGTATCNALKGLFPRVAVETRLVSILCTNRDMASTQSSQSPGGPRDAAGHHSDTMKTCSPSVADRPKVERLGLLSSR